MSDEPTMLELMFQAQKEAQNSKVAQTSIDKKAQLGNGFKKGFFTQTKGRTTQNIIKTRSTMETVVPKVQSPLVLDEVQSAMDKDKSPMLKQLQQGGTLRYCYYY